MSIRKNSRFIILRLDRVIGSTNKAIFAMAVHRARAASAAFDGKPPQESLLTTKDMKEHKEMCQSPENFVGKSNFLRLSELVFL